MLLPALLLPVLLLATACGDTDPGADTDTSGTEIGEDVVVTVAFHDKSVPPPHHESWTVTLSAQERTRVVDSYGDVLESTETPMDAAAWAAYVEDLPDRLDQIGTEDRGESCPGGTAMELVVEGAGDADRHVSAHLGCDDDGEEVAGLIEDLADV